MQRFISKYAVAAHLALLAVSPLFLYPAVGAAWTARVLLWLSLFAAVWVLMEPSRRVDEMLHDARSRVAGEIVRDPLFWFSLVLIALSAVRWANDGIVMAYDFGVQAWCIREPVAPGLPGSVSETGFLPFAVAVALCVLLQGCRHALGKSARISFLFAATLIGGVFAIVLAVGCAAQWGFSLAAANCLWTDSSFLGSAFGLLASVGAVALVGGYECNWNRYLLLFSLGIGGSLAGLLFFAPSAIVALWLVAFVLSAVQAFFYCGVVHGSNVALKCFCAVLIAALMPVLLAMWVAPADLVSARLAPFADGSFFDDGFSSMRACLGEVARKSWLAHPWLGTGLGSFGLDIRFGLAPSDWHLLAQGQSNLPHGWWLLLTERGLIGLVAALLVVALIGFTFARRIVAGGLRRSFFHPACWLGPIALVSVAVEGFVDVSPLRAEMILLVGGVWALAASSLPLVPTVSKTTVSEVKPEGSTGGNHG